MNYTSFGLNFINFSIGNQILLYLSKNTHIQYLISTNNRNKLLAEKERFQFQFNTIKDVLDKCQQQYDFLLLSLIDDDDYLSTYHQFITYQEILQIDSTLIRFQEQLNCLKQQQINQRKNQFQLQRINDFILKLINIQNMLDLFKENKLQRKKNQLSSQILRQSHLIKSQQQQLLQQQRFQFKYLIKGIILEKSGRIEEAMKCFTKASQLNPNDDRAQKIQVVFYKVQGIQMKQWIFIIKLCKQKQKLLLS